MLAQCFEFNCLSLAISVLEQSFGLLLSKRLLVLQLHELLVGQPTPLSIGIGKIASILGDRCCDS